VDLELISTSEAPQPGGAYAQAVRTGNLLLLAGQVGIDPASGQVGDGLAAQTRQAVSNLDAVLRAAGGSLDNLVKTTCFLAALDQFSIFNAAYAEALEDRRPARSTVGVALAGAYLIEIEGIAVLE